MGQVKLVLLLVMHSHMPCSRTVKNVAKLKHKMIFVLLYYMYVQVFMFSVLSLGIWRQNRDSETIAWHATSITIAILKYVFTKFINCNIL